ncbi:MAG: alpha/beta hydrolase, partial [Pseudomonadota bacterium]
FADRVQSLVSLSSSTGQRGSLFPHRRVALHMLRGAAAGADRSKFDYHDTLWQLLSSPSYPMTEAERHGFIRRLLDHGMSTAGSLRQAAAILADHRRCESLASVQAPTLVIHGDADTMLNVRGGRQTADAIPGATLKVIAGMGHDLPESLVPSLVDSIHSHAAAQT